MHFLTKLFFLIRRPRPIIILGHNCASASKGVFGMIKRRANVLILALEQKDLTKNAQDIKFFLKESAKPILVLDSWEPALTDDAADFVSALPQTGRLLLNFDKEAARELRKKSQAPVFFFGLSELSRDSAYCPDIQASDIHLSEAGVNFKLNYKGSTVPVWLKHASCQEHIYCALLAAAIGVLLDINLVELSQAMGDYVTMK